MNSEGAHGGNHACLRGREKANKDWGRQKLLEFVKTMIDPGIKS